MKKSILVVAGLAVMGAANAQWIQNDLINVAGGGTGAIAGQNLSQLETGETLFGFGAQLVGGTAPANNIVADDFTVGAGGWTVTGIRLYTYQTGATAPSITAANWAIGAAATTALTTGTPITNTWWNTGGLGNYRVSAGVTADTNRRIQEVVIDVPDFNLAAGVHFLSFQFVGALASGPWTPPLPTSNAVFGLNALQSVNGGAFVAGANGNTGADLAFVIEATPVPEPATMTILGLGALAAWRRRNKK